LNKCKVETLTSIWRHLNAADSWHEDPRVTRTCNSIRETYAFYSFICEGDGTAREIFSSFQQILHGTKETENVSPSCL